MEIKEVITKIDSVETYDKENLLILKLVALSYIYKHIIELSRNC